MSLLPEGVHLSATPLAQEETRKRKLALVLARRALPLRSRRADPAGADVAAGYAEGRRPRRHGRGRATRPTGFPWRVSRSHGRPAPRRSQHGHLAQSGRHSRRRDSATDLCRVSTASPQLCLRRAGPPALRPGCSLRRQGYPPWTRAAPGCPADSVPRRTPQRARPRPGGEGRSSGGALHLHHPGAARRVRRRATGCPEPGSQPDGKRNNSDQPETPSSAGSVAAIATAVAACNEPSGLAA